MFLDPLMAQLEALQQAERFVAGFEDDAAQQPAVTDLLVKLRTQIQVTLIAIDTLRVQMACRVANTSLNDWATEKLFVVEQVQPDAAAPAKPQVPGGAAMSTTHEATETVDIFYRMLEDSQREAANAAAPKLVLRFYDWECGHHQTRPGDIPVQGPDQATQILHAMSHCISQPGSFSAWLMNETHAVDAYVTDDYVRMCGDAQQFPEWHLMSWNNERPVLIYGSEEQIAELRAPENAEAVSNIWFFDALPSWDGTQFMEDNVATTTLPLAELQDIVRTRDSWEPESPSLFALPPIFKSAESALEEVRQERASIAACSDVQTSVPPASNDQGAA